MAEDANFESTNDKQQLSSQVGDTPPGELAPPTPEPKNSPRNVLIAIIAFVVGLPLAVVGLGLLLPSEQTVVRQILIEAPVEDVHAEVNDLSRWPQWTTWNTETHPNISYEFEGPLEGEGATMRWAEPMQGEGSVKITSSNPETGIAYTMDVGTDEPILGEIRYHSVKEGIAVTWTAKSDMGDGIFAGYLGLMFDRLLGGQLQTGLVSLKELLEKEEE